MGRSGRRHVQPAESRRKLDGDLRSMKVDLVAKIPEVVQVLMGLDSGA